MLHGRHRRSSSTACRSCSACSLVASRLVSMTFIPLLGYYLLRAGRPRPTLDERRKTGFAALLLPRRPWAIEHRWKVLAASLALLVAGGAFVAAQLKTAVLPEGPVVPVVRRRVAAGRRAARGHQRAPPRRPRASIRRVAEEYGSEHPGEDGKPRDVLKSLTTFVGGGGPRFWFSVAPGAAAAQLRADRHPGQRQARHRAPRRAAAARRCRPRSPGARIDVRAARDRQAVGIPVAVRISRRRHRRRCARRADEVEGDPRARSRRPSACATTGAPRASRCKLDIDRRPRELRRRHQPRRRRRRRPSAINGCARDARCAKATSRSPSSRGCASRSARSSPMCRTSTSTPRRTAREGAAAAGLDDRLRHGDREDPAPQSVPHDHRRRRSPRPARCRPRC